MSLIRLDKIGNQAKLYSVVLGADLVNGNVVALGSYKEFDKYNCGAIANVTTDKIILLAEQFIDKTGLLDEKDFVLKTGKTVRGYALVKDDFITLTADAITGTPVVGKYVVPAVGNILASATTVGTERLAFYVEEATTLNGQIAYGLRVIKA